MFKGKESNAIFTAEACRDIFKIQNGPLNCNSEKVLHLLKCKVCGKASCVGKAKSKFNNYKSKHKAFRKGSRNILQKHFLDHYRLYGHLGFDDWDFILSEQCETHEHLEERKIFWDFRLKTFYPFGLNEKEEYLYYHNSYIGVRQSNMEKSWLILSTF